MHDCEDSEGLHDSAVVKAIRASSSDHDWGANEWWIKKKLKCFWMLTNKKR